MKLRNKLMGLAVAAVMVVSAAVGFAPATAQAAGAEVALVPQATEVKAGETVVVNVELKNNTGMTGLILKYTYDEAFELVKAEDGTVLKGWVEPAAGTLMWKDSLAKENNTANGTIATLTFKATAAATVGAKAFGLTVDTCLDCNIANVAVATKDATVAIACSHTFGEWVEVKASTCTEKGLAERVCTVCGHKETKELDLAAHVYGEWTVVKEATCTEKGTEERVCECGHKETREIAAKGHVDADGDGKCDVCGKPVSPATGDSTTVMLWMSLAVVAAALVVYNKKRINA